MSDEDEKIKAEDEEISQTIVAKQVVRALWISNENLDKNLKKIIEGKEKNPDEIKKIYDDAQYDSSLIHTLSRFLTPPEKEKNH